MRKRLLIVDAPGSSSAPPVARPKPERLTDDFGRNLDTIPKARQWLTNPHNWHDSNTFILKWDGLLCTVNRNHGQRLIDEPNDNGLPEVVVRAQIRIRKSGKQDPEIVVDEQ